MLIVAYNYKDTSQHFHAFTVFPLSISSAASHGSHAAGARYKNPSHQIIKPNDPRVIVPSIYVEKGKKQEVKCLRRMWENFSVGPNPKQLNGLPM